MLQLPWPCPWIRRDPPSQVNILFTLWEAPCLAWCAHNAGFTCVLCSWGLSETLAGASECFQKLPAALLRGDSFVPTSLLAASNMETLINHFTSSRPSFFKIHLFVYLNQHLRHGALWDDPDVYPSFFHPSTVALSSL